MKRVPKRFRAFTLTELIVVIALTGILLAVLMPSLASARVQARSVACRSNLHQLVCANRVYTTDSDGYFLPGAEDMFSGPGLKRWHGQRADLNSPFEPQGGPLAAYLGNGRVKECPQYVPFVQNTAWEASFERGCGGYGYNLTYLGSRLWDRGTDVEQAYQRTTRNTEVGCPAETAMFADCALSREDGQYIEYSFIEPPHPVFAGTQWSQAYLSPSIHFRHDGLANVGWADGHAGARRMAPLEGLNAYGVDSSAMCLGWFDPADNSPFDLR